MRTTETIGTDMKENTIIEQLPTDKKANSYEYSAIDRIIEESGLRVSLGMIDYLHNTQLNHSVIR
jgi:predicted double-glycine peptidase